MIKRIFITFCLVAMAPTALRAGELSIKISLGIRDSKLLAITNLTYPLAFRIENIGKAVVKKDQVPGLFFKGVIHISPKNGKEQQTNFQKIWRTVVYDVQPGVTFESPVVGDILTFFPSTKDGDYQVWWTLGDFKSNILSFTVTNGKVLSNVVAAGEDASSSLRNIPPSDPRLYQIVRDGADWSNPYLIVYANGLEVRGTAGRVSPEKLATVLAKLPRKAWPYGRVVAVQEIGVGSGKDRELIRANVESVLRLLKQLSIEVQMWPSA